VAITQLAQSLTLANASEVKVTLITQNVDDLHERAGFVGAMHVYGSLFEPRCSACGRAGQFDAEPPLEAIEHLAPPKCQHCGGYVRPGVVWFGEGLDVRLWHQAVRSVQNCDVLLVVGTSGVVQPIASLPEMARSKGAWVCEINPQTTEVSKYADLSWQVTAAVGLPALIDVGGTQNL
jgi:NAD-dependent deacetylase